MSGRKTLHRKNPKFLHGLFRKLVDIKKLDLLKYFLFIFFGITILIISFLGRGNEPRKLILKEYAKERVVAEFPFSYESFISNQEKKKSIQAKTPPIFIKLDNPLSDLINLIEEINNLYASHEINYSKKNPDDQFSFKDFIKEEIILIEEFEEIDLESISTLYENTSSRERNKLFDETISELENLYKIGIYNEQTANLVRSKHIILGINKISEDEITKLSPIDYNESLISLKLAIDSLTRDKFESELLFNMFRFGLKPNLIFSESDTQAAINDAISDLDPIILSFNQGDTLIAPGQLITPLEIEKIKFYEEQENKRVSDKLIFNELFLKRAFIVSILLIIISLFIRYGLRDNPNKNRILSLSATAIILYLIIARLILEFGEIISINNDSLLAILPNFVPIALAPILIAVLIGAFPAILSTFIVSIIFCLGFDNSLDLFLITFLPGVVGVYASFNSRSRSKLLRACLLSGLVSALGYAILSIIADNSVAFISQQIVCSITIGFLTGVIVVGMLSAFEQVFKITTNITLLELTDFNHPILRRMQMEAPGTYHHSLMVANLSENAADSIGSDPLLCRVCCLFHDIGKLVKPEYFSENQRGINPHDKKNPSMSALVIKAHVKEGVEMAKEEKLPRIIIDIIKQHHGTSLIKYFFHQAKKQEYLELNVNKAVKDNLADEPNALNESTYRYDGPKPLFKESAIIFFADAVEAASRTLKKVSQPAIEEMIENIFNNRIEDGQLDQCPLTFMELNQIKNSFTRTLLNMLHSRVEYPSN